MRCLGSGGFVYVVGLTGGIASGKSTVSNMLAARGAVVIDADKIAREVVEPGQPALTKIVERFGTDVLSSDGTLDRQALGAIVFADPEANADLRAITHPHIGEAIAARMAAFADTDRIVVLDAPLLVESGWKGLAKLIVVAAHPDVQVERMLRDRDMSADEAQARIAAQASLDEKLDKADIVIWNDGDFADLQARVDEVWAELLGAARTLRT
jgi:dephospho-CoA kinase